MVYKDHDILRTTYHIDDNEVFQKIDNTANLDILIYKLSSLPEVEAKMLRDYGKHFLYTLSWFTTKEVLDDSKYDEFL